MDDPTLYPDQYHQAHPHMRLTAPPRRRFDRAAALGELLDATIDWSIKSAVSFLSLGDDAELELAHIRMQRALAVVAWENGRANETAGFPGPAYDEDTMRALLGGIQG